MQPCNQHVWEYAMVTYPPNAMGVRHRFRHYVCSRCGHLGDLCSSDIADHVMAVDIAKAAERYAWANALTNAGQGMYIIDQERRRDETIAFLKGWAMLAFGIGLG